MSRVSKAQEEFLLGDLHRSRISSRTVSGRSLSYVEAWDIKRYLIRVFGFAGFSVEVIASDLAFEQEKLSPTDRDPNRSLWNVGYRVVVRLTIQTADFDEAKYTEAAVGFASLPDRGEAHDMAIKTAESDALKRAAIYLGTQFGLSLYDNGSTADVVGRTLVDGGEAPGAPQEPSSVGPAPEVESATNAPEEPAQPAGKAAERDDEPYQKWMADLRYQATNPQNGDRVLAVTAMKNQAVIDFGPDFLDSSVTIQGRVMTYRTLADEVATGQFLKGDGS